MKTTFFALVLSSNFFAGFDDRNIVVEQHEITEIKNGYVHGENVDRYGEGIYYSIEELEERGITEIKKGDVYSFIWTSENYFSENWDVFNVKPYDYEKYKGINFY